MPGIALLIDGAIQQAAQRSRQGMGMRRMLSRRCRQSIPAVPVDQENESNSQLEHDMAKSAAFGVLHVGISFTIGYLLTGSIAIAGAITLIEPVANTIAHYFFDRWWDRRHEAARASLPS
jgi:uncharacterized membrane protein